MNNHTQTKDDRETANDVKIIVTTTKSEMKELHLKRLNELINYAGDAEHLAKMLGKAPKTVEGWILNGEINKFHAYEVEQHPTLGKKFKADYLRIDIFTYPMSAAIREFYHQRVFSGVEFNIECAPIIERSNM